MRLTRKDALPTVVTAAALGLYVLWLAGTQLVESPRALGLVVLALGWVGCMSVGQRMGEIYGVDTPRRVPVVYMVGMSLVGATAVVAGVVTGVSGNETALAILVTSTVVLWVVTTVRHAVGGGRAIREAPAVRSALHRVA